jgi:hypothetical protein
MTSLAKRAAAGRLSALPEPELVSLIGDPAGPYADSPEGWWSPYGGALNVASGVVYVPSRAALPPCPFPCQRCEAK